MRLRSLFLRSLKPVTAMLLAALIGGCESVLLTAPAIFAASTATLVYSKKLPSDHAASYMTKKDCSALNLEKQEDYCKDPNKTITLTESGAAPYCYRTIGTVTCYDRPLSNGRPVR